MSASSSSQLFCYTASHRTISVIEDEAIFSYIFGKFEKYFQFWVSSTYIVQATMLFLFWISIYLRCGIEKTRFANVSIDSPLQLMWAISSGHLRIGLFPDYSSSILWWENPSGKRSKPEHTSPFLTTARAEPNWSPARADTSVWADKLVICPKRWFRTKDNSL